METPSSVDDTQVDDTQVDDTQVDDTQVDDTQVDDTQVDDTQVDDTSPLQEVDSKEEDWRDDPASSLPNSGSNSNYFTVEIHEEPEDLLQAILGDQNQAAHLYQEVLQLRPSNGGIVSYWAFTDKSQCVDMVIDLTV
ncbi:hypothetical protein TrLO_g4641 [Triparma laevis f. longispina]|uniref:Uncharacterized protein n=1 Tax=Triparma laevis f. longispina TaxID=1714387 RepID=A0A9W7FAT9_9STRA|nr:hypothetical protein TrLO_g4641 [Triparma laevis f. longispina]